VSHFKEREENNCLNCNAVVHGRFCHICGQENIEPKESVWHLVSHFFQDITHFDGKFFSTLRYLLFKPGFLSREYMLGRRASYLNPIRMYVFTSAIFFLLFFSIAKPEENGVGRSNVAIKEKRLEKLQASVKGLDKQEAGLNDTVLLAAIAATRADFEASILTLQEELLKEKGRDSALLVRARAIRDSIRLANGDKGKPEGSYIKFSYGNGDYRTVMAYDMIQSKLPVEKKDKGIRRLFTRKAIDIFEKSNDKSGNFNTHLLDTFMHTLPQMFFLSLPMYALFLHLLYRRRKKYYYVNHAIFSIHVFCATFVFSIILMLLLKYLTTGDDTAASVINLLWLLGMLFYQYKSMRHFYQQRRAKTIVKFFILNLLSFITVMFLMSVFFLITLWKV
jgi:hypothetical protein